MKETFRCVAYRYDLDERCRRQHNHSGAHRYTGEVYMPKPKILPDEPEHGWSPYARFQDRG